MKKINFLLPALGMVLLASCNKQVDCPDGELFHKLDQVRFASTIHTETRAAGKSWDQGDAIGVFALKANQSLSAADIYEGSENVKHTTANAGELGSFVAAKEGIEFPELGSLDFIAYYPYNQNLGAGYTYPINVAQQTPSSAIDVLYSNNAKGQSKANANGVVKLNFKHQLSIVILNISAGNGVSNLDGLTAKIDGLKTDGSMNLATGAVTLGGTTSSMTPEVSVAGTEGKVAAILVPGQDLKTAKIVFTLGGKTFEWLPENNQMLESGKKYTYTLRLEDSAPSTSVVEVKLDGATITDWEDGFTGVDPIVLNPDNGTTTPVTPTTPIFTIDKNSVSLGADNNLSSVINLTANQAWTATSNQSWLTISPASGNSNQAITLTAQANTGAARTATVTLTATAATGVAPITVTVSQAAAASTPVTPAGTLLAPWSDFEDWTLFTNSLNTYGLTKDGYASQSTNGGVDGSSALALNGTPSKNGYVFTSVVKPGLNIAGKSKIIMWVKGTSAKSLSMNVYIGPNNGMGTDYKCFNVGDMSSDITVEPSDANSYTGTINTNGQWMKITLNIAGLTANSGADQNLFAVKVGKTAAYDLVIDNITVE